jgi:hypothetical protein
MKTRNLIIAVAMLGSWSAHSKVFNFKNSQTGQTMSVSCLFPSSLQCQKKIEEVKERLRNSTNPNSTTLTSARAADAANEVRDDASQLRDSVSSGISRGIESASNAGTRVRNSASEVGSQISDSVSSGVDSTLQFGRNVRDTVADSVDEARGQRYRVQIPGIEHTMTFHCHGGLESEECKSEKAEVAQAIRDGSVEETLAAHKMRPARDVAASVADTTSEVALSVGRTVSNGVGRLNHGFCKRKLERFAGEFDDSYRVSGRELVSYEVKMEFIKEKLEEGNNFDACEEQYNTAVLGYQLKWAAGGSTDLERTHIFDGLGRFANGDMGYWKNEERAQAPNSAQR